MCDSVCVRKYEFFVEFFIVCCNGTAFARCDGFYGVKTEACHIGKRTDLFALVGRTDGMGCILDKD